MKDLIKKLLREAATTNSLSIAVSRPHQELILMRGVPGSGKSTAAKNLVGEGVIHSTDNLIDLQGSYRAFFESMQKIGNFGPLSKMHRLNLENAVKSMEMGSSPVIIDNTNLRPSEMKKYVVAALELGYADDNIKVVNVGSGHALAEELAARNLHGVPAEKIEKMMRTFTEIKKISLQDILESKDMESDILYSAVVLDQKSHDALVTTFSSVIPPDWKRFAHHMTITFGKSAIPEDLGKEVSLVVTQLGQSDMAIAARVEGYRSTNTVPHITIAINPNGGKPVMSNQITSWKDVENIPLEGVVTNVKR